MHQIRCLDLNACWAPQGGVPAEAPKASEMAETPKAILASFPNQAYSRVLPKPGCKGIGFRQISLKNYILYHK